jgi:hypothetical protein
MALRMGAQIVSETFYCNSEFTRLIAWEDFTAHLKEKRKLFQAMFTFLVQIAHQTLLRI